ncbi:MAG: sigma-70 family RNA polymerase sigma factor [Hyphomonadaceae bacterium]|nr:sigma-70 family RNA polymerase sigma factor [Hyphomonadaceae bacterium]
MGGGNFLAERFAADRGHLRAVAYRMLGSQSEAEDAVQEVWLRLALADTSEVQNLRAWMTTVVARVCLDILRSRKARREEPIAAAESMAGDVHVSHDLEIADSVGLAMLVVLETLSPAERVAFVLHDIFNLPFEDIAPIVSRSPAAARQLASRARRRVQGAPTNAEADRERQRNVVTAFLAASRGGDFSALLAVLDPAVVLRADASAVAASVARLADTPELAPKIHGQSEVAKRFQGRLRMAQLALVEGDPGLVIAPGGTTRMVIDIIVEVDRIVEISLIGDAQDIEKLQLQL